jgi:ribosome biogenesis GTPase
VGKKHSRKRGGRARSTREVEPGEVIEMLGLEAIVRPLSGVENTLRARLRKGIARNPGVVVGDLVDFHRLDTPEGEEGGPEAVIEKVGERRNLLLRAGFQGRRQLIASNLDYAVIVVSPADPPLRLGLVDRYLVACRQAGIAPMVCLNKKELDTDGAAVASLGVYQDLSIPVACTRAAGPSVDVAQLVGLLGGKRSILVGHSGVGKSSLARAMIPNLVRAVASIIEATGRGRHTTTTATLLTLPDDGGELVDTPGIRSFGLFGVEPEHLQDHYPEYVALADECRFRGCTHSHEPGCAVKGAIENETLDAARHERYLDIRESLDEW